MSNLIDPPARLLSPSLVLRVLRANLRRRRGDIPLALDRPAMAPTWGEATLGRVTAHRRRQLHNHPDRGNGGDAGVGGIGLWRVLGVEISG